MITCYWLPLLALVHNADFVERGYSGSFSTGSCDCYIEIFPYIYVTFVVRTDTCSCLIILTPI